ncbi:MAG TPA: hypothetical protein VF008_10955 [Niastella sp.]
MKSTTIKSFVLIIVALTAGQMIQAQTKNVSERFSTQLKNGTVPGWQFSTEKSVPPPAINNQLNEKENLITQIRKGTAAGLQFKPVTGGSVPVMARAAIVVGKQPLASEQSVTANPAKVETVPVVPKQE